MPEQKLACAVVKGAIDDLISATPRRIKVKGVKESDDQLRARIQVWRSIRDDAYQFLTGQTEIAKFWLQAANMRALTGSFATVWRFLLESGSKRVTIRTAEQVGGA